MGEPLRQQDTYKGDAFDALGAIDPAARKLSIAYFDGEEGDEKTNYTESLDINEDVTRTSISFYGDGTVRAGSAAGLALHHQDTYKGGLTGPEITSGDQAVIDNRLVSRAYFRGEEVKHFKDMGRER